MKLLGIFSTLLLVSVLCGCSFSSNHSDISDADLLKFEPHVATKAQVIAALGKPDMEGGGPDAFKGRSGLKYTVQNREFDMSQRWMIFDKDGKLEFMSQKVAYDFYP